MIVKRGSLVLCLLILLLHLSSPRVTCLENCHARIPSCHAGQTLEPVSKACPHSKSASPVAIEAKLGCECAIQADRPLANVGVFTLLPSQTNTSKLPPNCFESSSKTLPGFLEARLHGPPFSLELPEQNTFLLNSNLRI
jgi:hypothetical protein